MESTPENPNRRPLSSRRLMIFQNISSRLAASGVNPNTISMLSMLFGITAGGALVSTAWSSGILLRAEWLVVAVLIQLRLLCNMLDGMVAIKSQRTSSLGELYNELPDRVSDVAIFIGAGYALGGVPILGYATAVVAVFVAYVRAIGVAAGAGQAFHGPMAKPQRMFILTVVCIYCGVAPESWQPWVEQNSTGLIGIALGIIIVGGVVTATRRIWVIGSTLRRLDT